MNRRIKSITVIMLAALAVTLVFGVGGLDAVDTPNVTAFNTIEVWEGDVGDSFGGGLGTITNPYQINNGSELAYLTKIIDEDESYANKHYILTQDIYLNSPEIENVMSKGIRGANTWKPITMFGGRFDGMGHTIHGLFPPQNFSNDFALFAKVQGTVEVTAEIVNLTVKGVGYSNDYVAGIAAKAEQTVFENCNNYVRLNGKRIGGIVAKATNVNINNCHNYADLDVNIAQSYIGGIVAEVDNVSIRSCSNWGNLNSTSVQTTNNIYAGGIVGYSIGYLYINESFNNGNIQFSMSQNTYAGGILGRFELVHFFLDTCANYGMITAKYAGGIIGQGTEFAGTNIYGDLKNSYNAGYIRGVEAYAVTQHIKSIDYFYNSGLIDGSSASGFCEEFSYNNNLIYLDSSIPDLTINSKLERITKDYDIVSVFASWAGDTRRLVHTSYTLPNIWDGSASQKLLGEGTLYNPYLISSAQDLAAVRVLTEKSDTVGLHFVLTDNIYLNDTSNWDIDISNSATELNKWSPIGTFSKPFGGVFDGRGYKISGLYIDDINLEAAGLFGVIKGGVVKNLQIDNSYIRANNCGAVVGMLISPSISSNKTSILGCRVNAYIHAELYGGGIVGEVIGEANAAIAIITDCQNKGFVSGTIAGGIAGLVDTVNIVGCYNKGIIEYNSNSSFNFGSLGGIVGAVEEENKSTLIANCYNIGEIQALAMEGPVGGIAGELLQVDNKSAKIINCFNTATINSTGLSEVGGIVGRMDKSTIANCYNSGVLYGVNAVGGLAGGAPLEYSIINSYYYQLSASQAIPNKSDYAGCSSFNGSGIVLLPDVGGSMDLHSALSGFVRDNVTLKDNYGNSFALYDLELTTDAYYGMPLALIYQRRSITVKYMDGDIQHAEQAVYQWSKLTPPEISARVGYTFLGWYEEDAKWNFAHNTVTDDLTLHSKWSLNQVVLERIDQLSNSSGRVEFVYTGSEYDLVVKAIHPIVSSGDTISEFTYKWMRLVDNEYVIIGEEQTIENTDGFVLITYPVMNVADSGEYKLELVLKIRDLGVVVDSTLSSDISYSVDISKSQMDFSINIDDWTYGDEPNSPQIIGAEDRTDTPLIKYSIDGVELDDNVPVNAGEYTVQITFLETDNYLTSSKTTSFQIFRKKLEADWGTGERNYVYSGYEQNNTIPSISGIVNGDYYVGLNVVVTQNGEIVTPIDVGEYLAVATISNPNYILESSQSTYPFRILKRPVKLKWVSDNMVVYNGQEHFPKLDFVSVSDEEKGDLSLTTIITNTNGDPAVCRDAGLYVVINSLEHKNYTLHEDYQDMFFYIEKASLKILDWGDKSDLIYNGTNQMPTPVIEGLIGNDKVFYTIEITNSNGEHITETKDVGEYWFGFQFGGDSTYDEQEFQNYNYSISYSNFEPTCKYIINPRVVKGEVTGSVTYYDEMPILTYKYDGFVTGEENLAEALEPVSSGYTQGLNANAKCLIITPSIDLGNYIVEYEQYELTVAPAELLIKVDSKSIVYGDNTPTFEVSYIGLRGDDTEELMNDKCVIICPYTKGDNVGEYALSVAEFALDNYTISTQCGSLIVRPKLLTDQEAEDLLKGEFSDPIIIQSGKLGDTLDKWVLNEGWQWVDNTQTPQINPENFLVEYGVNNLNPNYDFSQVSWFDNGKIIRSLEVSAEPTFLQSHFFVLIYSGLALLAALAMIIAIIRLRRRAIINKQTVNDYLAQSNEQDKTKLSETNEEETD